MGAITLSDLNNYMKNYPTGVIVPENAHWDQVPLFKALRPSIDRSVFRGQQIEVLMETASGAPLRPSRRTRTFRRAIRRSS